MKKFYAALSLFTAILLSAQVPQAFSYQTIAFNASGVPIANGNVSLKVSILENTATGTVLYTETHNKTTNAKGLVNLNIGQGTPSTGNFGSINWGTNSKFVKVEMDPQGGSNYTNVGVNQLMSVPYAQVSKTVVTGAGQGITLVSPNGTNYTLNVNDSGTLNLPVSSSSSTQLPANLYMYGSYNNFTATSADLMRNDGSRIGYKYLPANTQIRFIAAQNASAQNYGSDGQTNLVPNGSVYNISSNGFYKIEITNFIGNPVKTFNFSPGISLNTNGSGAAVVSPLSYNQATGKFSFNLTGVTSSNFTGFTISLSPGGSTSTEVLGDNLSDGNFDINGTPILIPNLTSAPKNFKIEFNINFDATGTYTITQI
ncbi:hypothetical protein [Chryseobacterium shigense]|uniref:Uncharacterized protein n=1 Tax=Chryseobacterium shigense TaxID=297244 RepID=A0A841MZT9_9FLAO|nr:hypothetical protein [Chryseobacterium shigense]MBB6370426.1 hypothetical protein [Chryseobacterium shigense]